MSYLVPITELSAGGFLPHGSGSSNVDRINTAPTSDTSNGIVNSMFVSEAPCAYQLSIPSVGIKAALDVKIGIIAAAGHTEDSGTYDFTLYLKSGGASGTVIASVATSRGILATPVFSGTEYTLVDAEPGNAAAAATDLCLVVDDLDAGFSVGGGLYISELWLEYTESSGGGAITSRRRMLPLMGVG